MSAKRKAVCTTCGLLVAEHEVLLEAGVLSWKCPPRPPCVCGNPGRPGRHGVEFCEPSV